MYYILLSYFLFCKRGGLTIETKKKIFINICFYYTTSYPITVTPLVLTSYKNHNINKCTVTYDAGTNPALISINVSYSPHSVPVLSNIHYCYIYVYVCMYVCMSGTLQFCIMFVKISWHLSLFDLLSFGCFLCKLKCYKIGFRCILIVLVKVNVVE